MIQKKVFSIGLIFPTLNFFFIMSDFTNVTITYAVTSHTYSMRTGDTFERSFQNVTRIHDQTFRFEANGATVMPHDSLSSLLHICKDKSNLEISAIKYDATRPIKKVWIYRPYKADKHTDNKLLTIKKRDGMKYVSMPLAQCVVRLKQH